MSRVSLALAVALSGASACGGSGSSQTGSTTTGDPGSTGSTGVMTGGTTFQTPDACQGSDDCETDGRCIAPYDPGAPTSGPGASACLEQCVDVDDLTRWCFDNDGCCAGLQCRRVDGFCEPVGVASTGGTTGLGSGSTSGGSSGGSGSTGSTG